MELNNIKQVVNDELTLLDELIKENLYTNISIINDIIGNIIKNSGKRIRPLLVILSTKASATSIDSSSNSNLQNRISMAAAMEFIHTATLLHDDVVDSSTLRRGLDTANSIWGNSRAILVGDFLYSRSFQLINTTDNLEISKLIAHTTNKMAEGEILQLESKCYIYKDINDYLNIIKNKTAVLFAACTKVGAILANQSNDIKNNLADFGMHLGMAFQLIDDALDYSGNASKTGKNIGDDLAEGKVTMPLLYALNNANSYEKNLIKNSITNTSTKNIEDITSIINKTKAIDYTFEYAKQEANLAIEKLNILPKSKYKSALIDLTNFIINRSY